MNRGSLLSETNALEGHLNDNLPVKSNDGSVLNNKSEIPPTGSSVGQAGFIAIIENSDNSGRESSAA